MIRKALQVSKQNHKTKVPHLYNLNNIIAFLIIANTRQIPLYQFMICWTQNFVSITVNLYKGLKIGLLLFNSNVQVLLLLLPVVAADSFGLTIFRFEPYVSNIVFHRPLQRLDSIWVMRKILIEFLPKTFYNIQLVIIKQIYGFLKIHSLE